MLTARPAWVCLEKAYLACKAYHGKTQALWSGKPVGIMEYFYKKRLDSGLENVGKEKISEVHSFEKQHQVAVMSGTYYDQCCLS